MLEKLEDIAYYYKSKAWITKNVADMLYTSKAGDHLVPYRFSGSPGKDEISPTHDGLTEHYHASGIVPWKVLGYLQIGQSIILFYYITITTFFFC